MSDSVKAFLDRLFNDYKFVRRSSVFLSYFVILWTCGVVLPEVGKDTLSRADADVVESIFIVAGTLIGLYKATRGIEDKRRRTYGDRC